MELPLVQSGDVWIDWRLCFPRRAGTDRLSNPEIYLSPRQYVKYTLLRIVGQVMHFSRYLGVTIEAAAPKT